MTRLDMLRLVVGWVIVAVWVISLLLDVVLDSYSVPPTVHGLMMLVAGALFGPAIAGRRNGNGNGHRE